MTKASQSSALRAPPSAAAAARFPSLQGRAVMVTGGGSGIGAAMVEAFARQGARVAFIDIATEPSEALCQ
ncbi:MAG: SDR family NAD(P)-dependent oxidoreductase, partial [Pseudomonadota bacterium]|nr:SDR family NAD(P)-dependent oxidoreductase [Pseudomonadota bacterium]